jgi:hypothetical protein
LSRGGAQPREDVWRLCTGVRYGTCVMRFVLQ